MKLPISFAAAILLATCAQAQPVPAEQEPVHVSGMRNPELKPYRVMSAGLDAFEDHHDLAPNARELRFKLRPRASAPPDAMDNLSLRIAGDTISIPVPLAPDGSFVLPRSEQAYEENADLQLNKKKGSYRWQPDIHSPYVPTTMRRLGDLRLECQVKVAIAKKEMGFWIKALVNSFLLSSDWCNVPKLQLHTAVERKLAGATLLYGQQRIRLHLSGDGEGYVPPLSDRTYPDDTLIELKYADDVPNQ